MHSTRISRGNPEEDEHTLAVTGMCVGILVNGAIIIVVAATCKYWGRFFDDTLQEIF